MARSCVDTDFDFLRKNPACGFMNFNGFYIRPIDFPTLPSQRPVNLVWNRCIIHVCNLKIHQMTSILIIVKIFLLNHTYFIHSIWFIERYAISCESPYGSRALCVCWLGVLRLIYPCSIKIIMNGLKEKEKTYKTLQNPSNAYGAVGIRTRDHPYERLGHKPLRHRG